MLRPERSARTAEAAAKDLLTQIRSLRGQARTSWQKAHRRVFDIGLQAGAEPGRPFEEVRLTAETLRQMAAVGVQVQVTVYPAQLKA